MDDGTVALPLYLYLAENADGYNLAFSPAHIKTELGFSPERTRRGRDSLIRNGYLVAVSEREYRFYSMPVDVCVDNDIHADHSSTNEDMYADAGNPHREDGEPVCADTQSNIIDTIHTINNINISESIDDNNLPTENDMNETIEAVVENDTETAIVSQNDHNIINSQNIIEIDGSNNTTIASSETTEAIDISTTEAISVETTEANGIDTVVANGFNAAEASMLSKRYDEYNILLQYLQDEYGHLDDTMAEVCTCGLRRNYNIHDLSQQITRLKRYIDKHKSHREAATHKLYNDIYSAYRSTCPKDCLQYAILDLIIKRYEKDHPEQKNVLFFIDGWNQEKQEPNVTIVPVFSAVPELIRRKQQNISGIPSEYYSLNKPAAGRAAHEENRE